MPDSLTPMEIISPESVEPEEDFEENDDLENEVEDEEVEDTEEEETTEDEDTQEDDEDSPDDEDGEEDEEEEEKPDEDTEADEQVRVTTEKLQEEADAVQDLLGKSNIDYNALCDEYLTDGKLSKDSINALEKAGFSEQLVKGYIEGQQARMSVYTDRVQAFVGGPKEYGKLMKWAAKNLNDKEIEHFDKAVESYDLDEAKFAIKGLMALRDKAVGVAPKLVKGRAPAVAGAVKGFSSLEEMAKFQEDPRYETDVAYTRMVERRMLASDF